MFDQTLVRIGAFLDRAEIPYMIIGGRPSGRPRDIEDVQSVILKSRALDISYIEKWLTAFDDASDDKQFLSTFRGIAERSPGV